MMKKVFLILSFVPLLFHFPYLLQAWNTSRLDHYDWIFFLAAVPAAFWAVRKEKWGKCDYFALFLLVPVLLLTSFPALHHINALCVASALGVIFAFQWLLGGWAFAYRILPVAILLLLGTPSSSYQLSLLLMFPVWGAWVTKFVLAILCFTWIWYNNKSGFPVKKGTLFFLFSVLFSVLILLHTKELYFEGVGFVPEFPVRSGDFWGRRIGMDENTRRFFATSTVRQIRYTKNNVDISVLAVKCGKNIHEIHPASHCLRTSQWTVLSEKILHLRRNFAVTEIEAQKGGNHILVWVWYSSKEFSTPGFLGFRRHFKAGRDYFTYQVSVPVYENTNESRKNLHSFLQTLKGSKNDTI